MLICQGSGEMKHRKKLWIAIIAFFCVWCGIMILQRPTLKTLEGRYGFSTDGLKIETLEARDFNEWREDYKFFAARVSGEVKGSIFDTTLMTDEITDRVKNDIEFITKETKTGYDIRPYDSCSLRTLYETSGSAKVSRMHILYNRNTGLYYIYCCHDGT